MFLNGAILSVLHPVNIALEVVVVVEAKASVLACFWLMAATLFACFLSRRREFQ